jgi:hypothetical protein
VFSTLFYDILLNVKRYSFNGEAKYCGQLAESVSVDDNGVITGQLSRNFARVSSWPEPPHVALANLEQTANAAVGFTRKYGALSEPSLSIEVWSADGEEKLTGPKVQPFRNLELPVQGKFSFEHQSFVAAQNWLRLAWRGDPNCLPLMRHRVQAANFQLSVSPKEAVEVRTAVLWDFINLVFLIDFDTGRARICANERCRRPYFLKQRVDQECCSHRCAVERNNQRRLARWWDQKVSTRR